MEAKFGHILIMSNFFVEQATLHKKEGALLFVVLVGKVGQKFNKKLLAFILLPQKALTLTASNSKRRQINN